MTVTPLHQEPVAHDATRPPTASLRLIPSAAPRPERSSPEPDLVGLCDLVAEALGAPVTIEDVDLNVLAFSDHRGVVDPSRTASILGRRVVESDVRRLTTEGVLARLYSRDAPVVVAPRGPDGLGRVAQRIRGDEQTFGAIWAATSGDLSPTQLRELRKWSGVAARYFLQQRLDADEQLRDQSLQLSRLLAGQAEGPDLEELGIRDGVSVLAVRPAQRADVRPETAALELQRLSASLRMHLSAVHPACVVAPVDDAVYALVPARGSAAVARERAIAVASRFLESATGVAGGVTIGIGGPVCATADLPRVRGEADAVLRLLGPTSAGQVVHADAVQVRVLMMELGDLVEAKELRLVGPVMRLAEYDAANKSDLLGTAEAWLNSFGDVNATADAVHVHANTVRYRLRRVVEVGGLDLDCSEARYEAMVQIRLLRAAERAAAVGSGALR